MSKVWTPAAILELRTRLHMTQGEFASEVGVSSATLVSLWESGRHRPCRMVLMRITMLSDRKG